MKKTTMIFIVILAMVAFVEPAASQSSTLEVPQAEQDAISAAKSETGLYIVVMEAEPVLTYEGDEPGFAATKPGKSGKVNPNSAHVRKYSQHLKSEHNSALQQVAAR